MTLQEVNMQKIAPGLIELLERHPEVEIDFAYEHLYVSYIDRSTGEVILQVPTLLWESMHDTKRSKK